MARDWGAVAAAIQARLGELDMTQADLASQAGVAQETVRELRTNLRPRRRSPRTLAAVSEALRWPADHLATVAAGAVITDQRSGDTDELGTIASELTAITTRLADIAARLSKLKD